jgi:hypothetical protein
MLTVTGDMSRVVSLTTSPICRVGSEVPRASGILMLSWVSKINVAIADAGVGVDVIVWVAVNLR